MLTLRPNRPTPTRQQMPRITKRRHPEPSQPITTQQDNPMRPSTNKELRLPPNTYDTNRGQRTQASPHQPRQRQASKGTQPYQHIPQKPILSKRLPFHSQRSQHQDTKGNLQSAKEDTDRKIRRTLPKYTMLQTLPNTSRNIPNKRKGQHTTKTQTSYQDIYATRTSQRSTTSQSSHSL